MVNYSLQLQLANQGEGRNRPVRITPQGAATALIFFRQVPAGVSGAYRLLANLIALPKH